MPKTLIGQDQWHESVDIPAAGDEGLTYVQALEEAIQRQQDQIAFLRNRVDDQGATTPTAWSDGTLWDDATGWQDT